MRNSIVFILFGWLLTNSVFGKQTLDDFIPQAQAVGDGRMSVLFWDVYDARLYAPAGEWQIDKPFALELSYLMEFSGSDIADRSVEEIRKQGFDDEVKLADWHSQMSAIFPDVSEGVKLIGIYTSQGESVFLHDDEEIGRITDPDFGQAFFNIWLGESTSAPELRKKLLGGL